MSVFVFIKITGAIAVFGHGYRMNEVKRNNFSAE